MLSYMLARNGVDVTLLEAHQNFDRDFRGDALNPSVLELMHELGLADRLFRLRHARIHAVTVRSASGVKRVSSYHKLKTRFPFVTLLPQVDFLNLLVDEAQAFPNFRLIMGARVESLIEEGGKVRGVRYATNGHHDELTARLTVGADGRFSKMRQLSKAETVTTSPAMDVLWLRLPRGSEKIDGETLSVYCGRGYYMALTDKFDHWQISYVIPKGSYPTLRARGLDAFRRTIVDLVPEFADSIGHLTDWKQAPLLSVSSNRVKRWYRDGLLLIGDAAHVMSSVGGFGINCAIQDSVVAANVLSGPLKNGGVTVTHLARIQRRRSWEVRLIQMLQTVAQNHIIARALDPERDFDLPLSFRVPFVGQLAARIVALGIGRVRVNPA
jgi:2-polyprenyl-6-methoxyphenol hydroxylase-like FAD-dependent oxidoreductase